MKKILLIAALFLPAMAHGQTRTPICSNATASGTTITCVSASGVAAGSLVFLPFISDNGGGGGNAAVSSIAGCGTSGTAPFATGDWKIATSQNNNSDSGWIFYNENAAGAAGPCTITLTLAVSQNHLSIAGVQYSGLPTAYSLDTYGPSRFDGTPTTLNVTTQQTGELVVSVATAAITGTPGTFSSSTGSALVTSVSGAGANSFGFFDTLAASAGLQTVTMTSTSTSGYGSGLIAAFRYSLPAYGRIQKALVPCSTLTCAVTLPNTRAGDRAIVMPMGGSCQGFTFTSSNGELPQPIPAVSACNLTPQYFTLAGGDTTITVVAGVSHLDYLAVEEITGNLNYWNGSAFETDMYSTPLTTYNITGAGTCYLVTAYNLRQIPTTASAGFLPLYFSSQQVGALGTNNYDWWEQIAGGAPYSNVAGLVSGSQSSVISSLYSFCSGAITTPQARQANWSGNTATVPTQNAVKAGNTLIVHNVATHAAVTWTLTSSPSNTWVQIAGCGVGDFFCDWIAWSAAAGVTTFTVPAVTAQTLYQEVTHLSSIRHSAYSAPATGSTSYTTGTVSATAGDYLLAFNSCHGGFTGCTPLGQNSANAWTLRNDGAWADDTGNQAFDQIAASTTTYALPYTVPSTGYDASSSIYDFVPSATPVIVWKIGGSAKLRGAAKGQ